MSFGQNLQFLRKMRNKMTQEELCNIFSCSMDQLIREDMNISDEAYSDIRTEVVEPFSYIRYAVVSMEPEEDAIRHVKEWAGQLGVDAPQIIWMCILRLSNGSTGMVTDCFQGVAWNFRICGS